MAALIWHTLSLSATAACNVRHKMCVLCLNCYHCFLSLSFKNQNLKTRGSAWISITLKFSLKRHYRLLFPSPTWQVLLPLENNSVCAYFFSCMHLTRRELRRSHIPVTYCVVGIKQAGLTLCWTVLFSLLVQWHLVYILLLYFIQK